MQHWGMRLRYALQHRGFHKSYALAYQLGVNESAVSRWKKGGPITISNAIALADALDVSLDWLLMDRGHMDISPKPQQSAQELKLHQMLIKLPKNAIHPLYEFLQAFEK